MKKHLLFAAFLCLFVFASCRKDNPAARYDLSFWTAVEWEELSGDLPEGVRSAVENFKGNHTLYFSVVADSREEAVSIARQAADSKLQNDLKEAEQFCSNLREELLKGSGYGDKAFAIKNISIRQMCSSQKDPLIVKSGIPDMVYTPAIPEPVLAEYTIMVYSTGSGDLDKQLINNLVSTFKYGRTEKVNMTYQFNLSKQYQSGGAFSGTVRVAIPDEPYSFRANPDALTPEQYVKAVGDEIAGEPDRFRYSRLNGETPVELYRPRTLTDYINWASKEYPARNYIMIIDNHGYHWDFTKEAPKTKSFLQDDNFGNVMMSMDEFVQGVTASNVKRFKCIYSNACESSGIEFNTAYSAFADYAVASANVAPTKGGDYELLLTLLNGSRDESGFVSSMKRYCDNVVFGWEGNRAHDLSFIDLKLIPEFNSLMKSMVDAMTASYRSKREMYGAAVRNTQIYTRVFSRDKGNYYFHPYIDIKSFLSEVDEKTAVSGESFPYVSDLSPYYGQFLSLLSRMLYSSRTSNCGSSTLSLGVIYLSEFPMDAVPLYQETAFDKATGWSSLMDILIEPLSETNPCFNTLEQ